MENSNREEAETHKANLLAERNPNSDAQALLPDFELHVQCPEGKILANDVESPCLVVHCQPCIDLYRSTAQSKQEASSLCHPAAFDCGIRLPLSIYTQNMSRRALCAHACTM
jgi:hypothetical protein